MKRDNIEKWYWCQNSQHIVIYVYYCLNVQKLYSTRKFGQKKKTGHICFLLFMCDNIQKFERTFLSILSWLEFFENAFRDNGRKVWQIVTKVNKYNQKVFCPVVIPLNVNCGEWKFECKGPLQMILINLWNVIPK